MSGFTNIQMAISPSGAPPAPIIVAFTADGTWVVPPGVTSIDVLAVGGGGSGNGLSFTPLVSGGGSGGCVTETLAIPVIPGETLSIFIGTGATDGNEDGSGSEIDRVGPITLASAGPGVGCNVDNSGVPAGNSGGAGCPAFVPFVAGPPGGVGGFAGGDATSDDIGLTFFWSGGGAGAGGDGGDGLAAAGNGGIGVDMSAGWGTTYGDNGIFGGGGAAAGFDGVSGTQGTVTTGHGANTGGGGSSNFGAPGPLSPNGDDGILLIRYTP